MPFQVRHGPPEKPPHTGGPPPPRRFTYGPPDEQGTRTLALYEALPGEVGQKGRCGDCGFLARRAADASGTVESVSNEERQHTAFLRLASGRPAMPWCYVRAADLPYEFDDEIEHPQAELESQPAEMVEQIALAKIMFKDRKCPEWWPYHDPETPAEHRRERDVMRLEEQRAAREERLAAMERQTAADSAKIQTDSLDIARSLERIMNRADQFTTKWTKRAFWLAIVGVLIVAASYLFPDLGRHIGEWIDRTLGYPLGH